MCFVTLKYLSGWFLFVSPCKSVEVQCGRVINVVNIDIRYKGCILSIGFWKLEIIRRENNFYEQNLVEMTMLCCLKLMDAFSNILEELFRIKTFNCDIFLQLKSSIIIVGHKKRQELVVVKRTTCDEYIQFEKYHMTRQNAKCFFCVLHVIDKI